MENNKKKAFTMVELLATIVILGIVSVTIILSVRYVINRSREKYYNTEREMIILAAKDYYSDNRSKLPKDLGATDEVTLKLLVDQKYIEPVKDSKGNLCVYENEDKKSKVIVQKIGNNKYRYDGYLYCSGNESGINDNEAPTITFSPNEEEALNNLLVKMSITDDIKVFSYKYVIYKNNEKYREIGYKKYKKEIEINLPDEGSYRIEASAYDISGNLKTTTKNYNIVVLPPDCSKIDVNAFAKDKRFEPNEWTNASSVSVDIDINTETIEKWTITKVINNDDANKKAWSGLTTKTKNLNLTEEGTHNVTITASNIKGETCEKDVVYNIDRTAPTLKSWSHNAGPHDNNSGITVSLTCKDNGSGVASYSSSGVKVASPTSSSGKTVSISCTDKAGNSDSFSRAFKVRYYSRVSSCGVESYKTCAHQDCGVASYKTCAASACGCYQYRCTLYKSCATSGCGVASYKSCATSDCGCKTYKRCASAGCETYSAWSSWSSWKTVSCASRCPSSSSSSTRETEIKNCRNMPAIAGCSGKQYKKRTRTRSCSTYKRGSACGCSTYNTCVSSACGVASYNSCRNSACGTETVYGSACNGASSRVCNQYNSCANSACGVASYKSCATSGCGVNQYKACWHY